MHKQGPTGKDAMSQVCQVSKIRAGPNPNIADS